SFRRAPNRPAGKSAAGGILQRITQRVASAASALVGRSIEAAGGGRRWTAPPLRNAAAQMRGAAETVGARAAYFALNNGWAASLIETLASSIIGEAGPRPQPQHPNKVMNRSLRRRF